MKSSIKNKMKKSILGSIILPLAGCYSIVECENPNNHVHRYESQMGIDIWLWQETNKEVSVYEGRYNRTNTMIDITTEDENFFCLLKANKITELNVDTGLSMDYLYRQLKEYAHDTLEFYYEYYTDEERTVTNSDGETETITERVYHDGWTTNPHNSDNTGRVRITHKRFILSKVIKENGEWVVKSVTVDDPQQYWQEYNYFKYPTSFSSNNNIEQVTHTDRYNKWDLPKLNVDEITPYTNVDTTTEGYQNWLNSKKTSMIEKDEISFLEEENIETVSLSTPSKEKVLTYKIVS